MLEYNTVSGHLERQLYESNLGIGYVGLKAPVEPPVRLEAPDGLETLVGHQPPVGLGYI